MATFQCLSIRPISPIPLTHHPPLSAQSALSASLITLLYPPNQPYLPHSSPSPIRPISPICFTPHPPLSAQSDPSASLITLLYPPNQTHLPHSSPSPICPISPICLTYHPHPSPKQVKVFQKTTILSYLCITLFT